MDKIITGLIIIFFMLPFTNISKGEEITSTTSVPLKEAFETGSDTMATVAGTENMPSEQIETPELSNIEDKSTGTDTLIEKSKEAPDSTQIPEYSKNLGIGYTSAEIQGVSILYTTPFSAKTTLSYFLKSNFDINSLNSDTAKEWDLFEAGGGIQLLHYPYDRAGEHLGFCFGGAISAFGTKAEFLTEKISSWFFVPSLNLIPVGGSMEIYENLRIDIMFGGGYAPRSLIIKVADEKYKGRDFYSVNTLQLTWGF